MLTIKHTITLPKAVVTYPLCRCHYPYVEEKLDVNLHYLCIYNINSIIKGSNPSHLYIYIYINIKF